MSTPEATQIHAAPSRLGLAAELMVIAGLALLGLWVTLGLATVGYTYGGPSCGSVFAPTIESLSAVDTVLCGDALVAHARLMAWAFGIGLPLAVVGILVWAGRLASRALVSQVRDVVRGELAAAERAPVPGASVPGGSEPRAVRHLRTLGGLRAANAVTEEEFAAAKGRVIAGAGS